MKPAKKIERQILHAEVDQAEVLARVKTIEKDINTLQEKAGEIRVEDDEDWNVACAMLIATVEKLKYVEGERKEFLKDVQKLVDRVEGWFAKALEDGETLEEKFRRAVADYALALDAKAHSLRLAASKLPEKDESKAIALLNQANECKPPKFPGIALINKTRVEIIDEKKLPDWAWKKVVDAKAIEAKFANGESVPGARALVDFSVRVTPSHAKGEKE